MTTYNLSIANAYHKFMTANVDKFIFDKEKGIFSFNKSTAFGTVKTLVYSIIIKNNGYLTMVKYPLGVDISDDDTVHEITKLLSFINYKLVNGSFVTDLLVDGEISFKAFTTCDTSPPQDETIKDSIMIPALMYKHFEQAIIAVLLKDVCAEEAYEMVLDPLQKMVMRLLREDEETEDDDNDEDDKDIGLDA